MRGRRRVERLGVLGGTFDPPHIGHLIVAQDVVEELALDRLLVVPAANPPHRETALQAAARYELTARAFEGADHIEVSDIEMRRSGPSYTVDTLAELRKRHAPVELFCIIGMDQLRAIESWHEYERLPQLARLVVMERGGDGGVESAPFRVPYERINVTSVDLSSTRVRERLQRGQSIRYLVPESIRADVEAAWRTRTGDPVATMSDLR